MAKIEKIGNTQVIDNKEDNFFYFPMISMACTGAVHIFFAPAICILWGVQHLPCHVSDGNAYVERCRCYLYGNKPDICPLVGNFNFGTG